ncbi:hypothetical protein ACOTI2_08190 [Achromobacter xylosoxidans]
MPTNTTESPITVTVDHDPRGVSVGVWQGSHCIYSGAHPLPAAPASPVSTVEQGDTRDWELTCHECDGSGHVYVKHQVAERKTDLQEFKEECECCEGRGFVFAFQDIPGIEEYVKACRPAAGDAQDLTLAQKYEDACILANANAQDAERYRWLCDKLGITKLPCAIERIIDGSYVADGKKSIDAAIDAAIAAQRQGDA